jgi:hypothetical protein
MILFPGFLRVIEQERCHATNPKSDPGTKVSPRAPILSLLTVIELGGRNTGEAMARLAECPRSFLLGALLALTSFAAAAGTPPPPNPVRPISAASLANTTAANPRIFALRPLSGPSSGGTAASVYGLNLADGSTVSIGGAAATGVSLASPTQINATMPTLSPGSVNDVVVTVPGSQAVTLKDAWFAQFLDVPPGYLFARPIEKLRRRGITTGCGGGNYCPADSVTRAQMAVFILRGEHGSDYHPPSATGTVFNDVPRTALFADWIEQLVRLRARVLPRSPVRVQHRCDRLRHRHPHRRRARSERQLVRRGLRDVGGMELGAGDLGRGGP